MVGLLERRLHEIVAFWLLISCVNEFALGSELVRRVLITNYSAFFASGILIYSTLASPRAAGVLPLLVWAIVLGAVQSDLNSDWLRARGVELSHLIVLALGLAAPLLVACFAVMRRFPISEGVLLGLGGLTYPLYLLHQTIGYIVFNHSTSRDHAVLLVALTSIAMIGLSWVFYELLDKPLHAVSRKVLERLSAAALPHVAGAAR